MAQEKGYVVLSDVALGIIENAGDLAVQEIGLLWGVKDELKQLSYTVSTIAAVLPDAEEKQWNNEVYQWLETLKDAIYEADDLVDEISTEASRLQLMTRNKKRKEVRIFLSKLNQLVYGLKLGQKVKAIWKFLDAMAADRKFYLEERLVDTQVRNWVREQIHAGGSTRTTSTVPTAPLVNECKMDMWLSSLELIREGSPLMIWSIVGMGGLGKTTVAMNIYNDNRVKNHFDVRGWVTVSQKYRIQELLLKFLKAVKPRSKLMILKDELHQELFQILEDNYSSNKDKLKGDLFEHLKDMRERDDEEFKEMLFKELKDIKDPQLQKSLQDLVDKIYENNGKELQAFSEDDLKKGLFRCLQGRRYLLVLDDIWDTNVWDEVSSAFPDKLKGSRILITSRNRDVDLHASPRISPYELPFLDDKESWELFSKKVFRGVTCPPGLEPLGREIAKSCQGLPLAIVVLGGLLANKEKSSRIWTNVISYLRENRTRSWSSVLDILVLSYIHLPRHLKRCFLYFGIFPEDFEISVRQLIQLWIAEGFVQQTHNKNVEDVAEDYLEELIDRSLIQVATRRADGGVKTCRILDLLQDFVISESVKQKFLGVCTKDFPLSNSKSRRLSIQCATNLYISLNHYCDPFCSRSLLCFEDDKNLYDESNLERLCKTFMLVRVLDLGNMATFRLIPKKIEKLILLRYLRIQTSELDVLPASICSLWNLETLDMRNSKIKWLPKEIWKLQKLRHLHLRGPASLPRTENMSLPNLQVLTGMAINQDTESLLVKARFPNVKTLGLHSLRGEESTLLSSLHPLPHLQTLKINGLNHLPSPESFHLTLTKITLLCKNISPTVVTVLGSLTELRILKIRGINPVQMVLNCDESSFRQLEVFKMVDLEIMHWNLGSGAMPSLQHLVIDCCKYLNMLPHELCCLIALRDVEVLYPSKNLTENLRQLQMKSGCKLQVYPPLVASN